MIADTKWSAVKLMKDKEKIKLLQEALEPFAKMDRPNCRLGELACTRGTGYERTHIYSKDFRQAAKVLKKIRQK